MDIETEPTLKSDETENSVNNETAVTDANREADSEVVEVAQNKESVKIRIGVAKRKRK